MSKKNIKIIIGFSLLVGIIYLCIYLYNDYRVKNAIIKVKFIDDLEIEVYSDLKIGDLIENINGRIISNKKIDTSKLGEKEIKFEYINEENIKIPYSFKVNIVDKTPPIISSRKTLTLYQGYNGNIMNNFFCGDNYDDEPLCEIKGEYDVDKIGSYPVVFEAEDSSGNKISNDFTINIIEKEVNKNSINIDKTYTNYTDIVNNYKTKDTILGIDVSKWQGDIDYKKVKESGVEFVFIRLGSQKGVDGEYVIDEKFIQNIKGFKENNINVGIYFFSYADSIKEAKNQAKWVVKQIKKYKIDLPIVFDWENWDGYRNYNLSFYHLNEIADAFIKEIENAKYKGMLYSSKYYLENVWNKTYDNVWLAHYTNKTDYEGKYKVWQLCDDGKIDGIEANVDIDIMYK